MTTLPPAKFLISKRLYLRPLEETDVPLCQVWINDPEIRRTLLIQRPMDLVAEKQWHASHDRTMLPKSVLFAIVLNDGDRHIGNTSLHGIDWLNKVAETGTLIGQKELWGEGYATEAKGLLLEYAFNTLGMERMESHAMAFNPASQRHLLKNGYVQEGVFRQRIFRDGARHDTIHYGLLRSEWLAHRAQT